MNHISKEQWSYAFKFWIAALAVAFGAWIIYELVPFIALIIIAFLVVYSILPLVQYLGTKKIPYFVSTIIAFVLIIFLIALLFYLLIPGLVEELRYMGTYLVQDFLPFIDEITMQMEQLDTRFDLPLSQNITDFFFSLIDQIPQYTQNILENISEFTASLLSGIWAVIAGIFVIFFMLIYAERIRNQLVYVFPQIYQERIYYIFKTINQKVGAYIRGTLVKCFIVGLLTGIALAIVDLPFAIVLGFLAGILNIILYIGPIVAAVPAVLLGFAPDTPHFLLIIFIYILVQIIDGVILTPFLLGQAVDLNPLTIILAVLIGAQLAGVFGIIVIIPLAAIGKVLFYHFYVEKLYAESSQAADENANE